MESGLPREGEGDCSERGVTGLVELSTQSWRGIDTEGASRFKGVVGVGPADTETRN